VAAWWVCSHRFVGSFFVSLMRMIERDACEPGVLH
jgi:hypothetical protein